ncbi:MAG: metalloregulator ArsR/SmtB family transcription factor [Ilumatobacteraceae bacterium]
MNAVSQRTVIARTDQHFSIDFTIGRRMGTVRAVQSDLDDLFRALADPSRRHIVERLGIGSTSVTELARPLSMSLPGVMQHLVVLERCGVVSSTKRRRVRTCSLEPAALVPVEHWASARRGLGTSPRRAGPVPRRGRT